MGLLTRNGAEYASRLTLTCSDGSVVHDPPVAVGTVRNVDTPVVRACSLWRSPALQAVDSSCSCIRSTPVVAAVAARPGYLLFHCEWRRYWALRWQALVVLPPRVPALPPFPVAVQRFQPDPDRPLGGRLYRHDHPVQPGPGQGGGHQDQQCRWGDLPSGQPSCMRMRFMFLASYEPMSGLGFHAPAACC